MSSIQRNFGTLVKACEHAVPLVCHLRRKPDTNPQTFMAEIELENPTSSSVEIEYQMAVLQYLELIVRDARGDIVSESHYGDRFSPFDHARKLRLAPSEKYRENVNLFATMPRGPIAPGVYSVQALYEYNGFRAESEVVKVSL